MGGELVRVDFHGDALWAACEGEEVFVAVRPICNAIAMDWSSQVKRIKRDPILSEGVVMMTTPSKGGFQESLCLPLRLLNGWLFGIDARRIRKPDVREKVIAYQRECYAVLHAHFHGAETEPLPPPAPEAADPVSAFDRADMRMLISLVSECRSTWGRPAAQRLWRKLPLPQPDDADAGEGDSVSGFLASVVRRASGARVGAAAIYAAYCRWCAAQGERPVTQTAFGLRLSERFRKRRGGGRVMYEDVTLE